MAAVMYSKSLRFYPDAANVHLKLAILLEDYLSKAGRAEIHYMEYLRLEPEDEKRQLVKSWVKRSSAGLDSDVSSTAAAKKVITAETESGFERTETAIKRESRELKKKLEKEKARGLSLEKSLKRLESKFSRKESLMSMKMREAEELQKSLEKAAHEYGMMAKRNGTLVTLLREAELDFQKEKELRLEGESKYKKILTAMRELERKGREKRRKQEDKSISLSAYTAQRQQYEKEIDILRKQNDEMKNIRKKLEKDLKYKSKVRNELQRENELRIARLNKTIEELRKELESSEQVMGEKTMKEERGFYLVKKGDSLRTIAEAIYGNRKKWWKIYEENKDQIRDPNLLSPGQRLRIPEEE